MLIPLGIKTDYELLDSVIKLPDLITFLKEKNIKALGIIDNNLSVKKTEKMVAQINKETDQSDKEIVVKEEQDKRPQYYREVELSLSESFGRKVVVNQKSKNSGTLVLEFYGEDDLKELLSHFKED